MKRLFRLLVMAAAAMALFSGCQKYDDSQIRQEIKDLGDRVAALEAWTRSSQEAVDYVAVLKEAVKNMKSIESVDVFEDEHGSGYVITFTNKQTIRLYNGNDGDAFFGNVNVGTSRVEFILADGTSFIVDRVTSSISFDSFDTKAVTKGHTVWTVMDKNFKKEDFAAFTAELKTDDGTVTSIATKSATDGNPWKIEAVAPEFGEDGKLVKPAGVIFKETPKAGSKGVLKVALITNDGKESAASIVVEAVPNYLAFEAVEAGATVSMEIVGQCTAPSLEYSTDLNEWTTFDFGSPQTITLKNVGDKVYWRNTDRTDHFSKDNSNCIHFILGDRKVAANGNIMSLVDSSCTSKTIPSEGCFSMLFFKNAGLTTAPELPAETLAANCYNQMFNGCSSMTKAPVLPAAQLESRCYFGLFAKCTSLKYTPDLAAVVLADYCCAQMFYGCTSLEKAPVLPATTLSAYCYYGMFAGCKSLEAAPALPATELPKSCYDCMFDSCSSLTEAPDILATKVGYGSCFSMFDGCASLKKAPALPAKQLDEYCYQQMFANCTSLEEAPELPAIELAEGCYSMMFSECKSLKEAPVLPALKMEYLCYFAMFQWCESLETAPELPAMELAPGCYASMFLVCPSLKNAPALPAMQLDEYCYQQMFAECTSLEEAPELPATELSTACYSLMFAGCKSLKEAPALPALKMAEQCYYGMFDECESLETAPALPATELAMDCYDYMFELCTSLKSAPALPAMKLEPYCYVKMFAGCQALEEAPKLPAKELAEGCYGSMFQECTSLENAPELPVEQLSNACYADMFALCTSLKEAPELPAAELAGECYAGMFYGCSSLNDIKVAFTDWGDGTATAGWVAGVGAEGAFECPEGLEVKYGDDYIPAGWNVNGAIPASAKSLSVPAKRAAGVIRCKPKAPKFPEIQDRVIDHGMMAL